MEVFLLGRSDDCDLVVPESNVSRRHAEIQRVHRGFRLRDLGSTNGTFRNADRAGELELRDGDIIQLGETAFLWEVLVNSRKGIRPIRDKILVDATARLEDEIESSSFIWLARLSRLRKELALADSITHLVVSLPPDGMQDVRGFAYSVTGDGTVTARDRLEIRLSHGSPVMRMLSRAVSETTYTPEQVEEISRGATEGSLPSEARLLGF
ncbi:MAG: FHA domain-containing protein [Deltaproteobacteria bacterium]|nr:FHA domain-containing protein [Deltaproteobacteria bacterium]